LFNCEGILCFGGGEIVAAPGVDYLAALMHGKVPA
jgi:hypothetical protein